MLALVTDFTAVVHDYVYGNLHKESFMQSLNAEYVKYKNNIWATAPRFAPVTSADRPELDSYNKPILTHKFKGIIDVADLKDGNADFAGKDSTMMNLDQVRHHVQK